MRPLSPPTVRRQARFSLTGLPGSSADKWEQHKDPWWPNSFLQRPCDMVKHKNRVTLGDVLPLGPRGKPEASSGTQGPLNTVRKKITDIFS